MKVVRAAWIAGLFAALALVASGTARAEFDIVISASTLGGVGGSIDINVFDPIYNVSSNPDVITVNTDQLNLALNGTNAGFVFDGLAVSKVPVDANTSQLNIVGTIRTVTGGEGVVVNITASAVDYTIPSVGTNATMTNTTSDSFSGGFGGKTFQSFYDASNTEFNTGAGTTPSSLLALPAKGGSDSDMATSPLTPVGIIGGNYALTNVTLLTLGAEGSSDLFTGVTTVRPVPEPGSIALVLIGGAAFATRLRRRRAQA